MNLYKKQALQEMDQSPAFASCICHWTGSQLLFCCKNRLQHGHVIPSITANCIALAIAGCKAGQAGQEAKTTVENKSKVQRLSPSLDCLTLTQLTNLNEVRLRLTVRHEQSTSPVLMLSITSSSDNRRFFSRVLRCSMTRASSSASIMPKLQADMGHGGHGPWTCLLKLIVRQET